VSNSTSAKILYLDETSRLVTVGKRLRQIGYYLDATDNLEDYFDRLDQTVYDLLLVNCSTSAFDGLDILPKSAAEQVAPVVVLVDPGDEWIAARAIQSGACTYLIKDHQFGFMDLLPTLIEQGRGHRLRANQPLPSLAKQLNGHYAGIIHNMQLGLHVYQLEEPGDDRTFRLIATNPAASQLTGLAEKDVLGKKIDEIFPELRRQGVLQRYAEVLHTGRAKVFEQEIYYGDDRISEAWLSFQVLPLPRNCIAVLFDNITLHKQAEESLKRSEARYRAIVEDQTELVDRYLPDGTLTFVNDAYCRYFGRKREALIGQSFFHHIPPEELVKVQQQVASLTSEKPLARLEHKVILPGGEVRRLEWTDRAILDDQGRIVEYQAVGRDVTKQKEAAEERERLLAAEREQRLLAETLHEVTLALTAQTSHESVLDEILRQARRLVPYDTAHIVLLEENQLRMARWHGYDRFGADKLVSNLTQSLADFPLEARVVQSKESVVVPDTSREPHWVTVKETSWIRAYITAPICHQNQVLGLLRLDSQTPDSFSAADAQRLLPLTNAAAIALENARLYEQTRQDAETRSVLLNEVNHRVKNNLSAIIGLIYAELSQFKEQERSVYEAVMQDLVNHVQGLATVHSMLSASNWKPLALSDLAGQIIRTTMQSVPLAKYVSTNVTSSPVRVSPKQADSLALVINELATNTAKHALLNRDTGQITVHIEIELQAGTGEVLTKLEYRDDGPGYPPDVIASDRQNVGLYLIKKIVRHDLGGALVLDNDHGAITTIRFRALTPLPDNHD
jgi:PAS domain S-box-containing protein